MICTNESIGIDHEFGNIIHKLLLIILLPEPNPEYLLQLVIPEVTHHRIPLLFLLHNIHKLILHGLHLQPLVGDLDGYVWLAADVAAGVEGEV